MRKRRIVLYHEGAGFLRREGMCYGCNPPKGAPNDELRKKEGFKQEADKCESEKEDQFTDALLGPCAKQKKSSNSGVIPNKN